MDRVVWYPTWLTSYDAPSTLKSYTFPLGRVQSAYTKPDNSTRHGHSLKKDTLGILHPLQSQTMTSPLSRSPALSVAPRLAIPLEAMAVLTKVPLR